jgi:peptide/nickel transport system permease protein
MTIDTTAASATRRESEVKGARRLRKRGRVTMWLAVTWLGFLVFTAVFANALPYVNHSCDQFESKLECSTYDIGSLLKSEKPPSWAWFAEAPTQIGDGPERVGILGTDRNGYDLFSRAMLGARTSLIIAGLSITIGLLFGTLLGLISGYYRGWLDRITETVMNVMLSFPALLLAIFMVTFLSDPDPEKKRSIVPVIVALSILSVPPLTRLVRANTVAYSEREFVMAARSMGAKPFRILIKEILPNIVPALVSFALTGLAILIVAEGALAYLGLSVEAPLPSWGAMIQAGTSRLRDGVWWISLMPALVMFLTILSFNLLGDVLAQRFNVREAIG